MRWDGRGRVHHLEGHLLSPLLADPAPHFRSQRCWCRETPQLLRVADWGRCELLGETLDDAAGEAFDKTAQLLGLGYPGGRGLAAAELAQDAVRLPRPMLTSGTLDFSFSGLKTAVLTAVRRQGNLCEQGRADIARAFVEAMVDVLASKARRALEVTGLQRLVVAGGVGANSQLRQRLRSDAERDGTQVYFPPLALCTDNGAMIALAGLARLRRTQADDRKGSYGFAVHPRWALADAVAQPRLPIGPFFGVRCDARCRPPGGRCCRDGDKRRNRR
jgi:N6-L-threonylcarbamoyladenine synthase